MQKNSGLLTQKLLAASNGEAGLTYGYLERYN